MQQGVHLIDPSRFDLRGNLTVGQDVRIEINVIMEGDCELGDNVEIGAGCIIKNTGLQLAPRFSHIAFSIAPSLGKIPKLDLLHDSVRVQNSQLRYISVTSLKLKIPRLVKALKPTTLPTWVMQKLAVVQTSVQEPLPVIMMVRTNLKRLLVIEPSLARTVHWLHL